VSCGRHWDMELCVVKGYIAENVHKTCCSPRDFRLGLHTSPPWVLRCPTNTNSTDQQAPGFYFSPQRLHSVRWGDASIPLRGFDMDEGLAAMRLRRATPSRCGHLSLFSVDNKCEGGSWFPVISFLVKSGLRREARFRGMFVLLWTTAYLCSLTNAETDDP
jgi:hypothetical protein